MGKRIVPDYNFKHVMLMPAFLLMAIPVFAQNTVNVQKNSLYAPDNLKIDGKTSEWNDQFQAYNKATNLFYNMANNNDLLYVGIKATDPTTIIKLLTNGITFTVNNPSNNINVAITFPLTKYNDLTNIRNGIRKKAVKTKIDSVRLAQTADSTTRVWNEQLALKLKEINISGIKELSDTISVYNDNGIKAALLMDNKKACTYELAVPLKYLGLSIAGPDSFNYRIQVNGPRPVKGVTVQISPNGRGIERSYQGTIVVNSATPEEMAMEFPSYFKGKYTLAKK